VGADYPPFVNAGASCSKGDDPDRPFHTNDSGSRVQIVSCPAAGVRLADVQLGDGNDKMGIQRDEIYRADGDHDQALLPVHRLAVHADGGPGNDLIESGVFADVLFGGPGDDHLKALGGEDVIRLGPGRDIGEGGLSKDRIYGGPGADSLVGLGGKDRIYGEAGNDSINGGGLAFGADRADTIYGGPGADRPSHFDFGKDSAADDISTGQRNP
jgi:Ca2+-binding RTX toxin-like protein